VSFEEVDMKGGKPNFSGPIEWLLASVPKGGIRE